MRKTIISLFAVIFALVAFAADSEARSLKWNKASIVDTLKSQGKDSSFQTRKALWRQAGHKDAYRGTASQNISLIKVVQNRSKAVHEKPAYSKSETVTHIQTPVLKSAAEPEIGIVTDKIADPVQIADIEIIDPVIAEIPESQPAITGEFVIHENVIIPKVPEEILTDFKILGPVEILLLKE